MNNKNKDILWTDRYCPKKSTEIIGNKKAISEIKSWLNSYIKINEEENNDDIKTSIIITGNHGIGKTISAHILLKEYEYTITKINFNEVNNSKDIETYVKNFTFKSDIEDNLYGVKNKKYAVIVDDIGSITSVKEKAALTSIQKYNEKYKCFPLIFISNNQHNKLLTEFKKTSIEIKFIPPNRFELEDLINKISKLESLKFDNTSDEDDSDDDYNDDDLIDLICEHSQFDVRRLINLLQELYYIYNNKIITKKIFKEFCISSKKKDTDISLFDATYNLLTSYKGIDDSLSYYESEKVLLPLMIHENYLEHIQKKCDSLPTKDKLKLIDEIACNLSKGDVVDGFVYGNQSWELQETYGFYTCVGPSEKLNNIKYKDKDGKYKKYKKGTGQENLKFTSDLNKTSIKNINKKNINNIVDYFPNKNIMDYLFLNKIVNKFILENKYDQISLLLKNYGVGTEQIDSLLKIDKIRNSKNNLTNKQKKDIEKYLPKKK
jgi:replication factor C subunit 1